MVGGKRWYCFQCCEKHLDEGGVLKDKLDAVVDKHAKAHPDKPRMDLIPPEIMTAMGTVMAHGAKKFAERGWEEGVEWGIYFAALQRHVWAWQGGEDIDMESGHSHLWHAACCLAILVAYEARGIGTDDREAYEVEDNQLEMPLGMPLSAADFTTETLTAAKNVLDLSTYINAGTETDEIAAEIADEIEDGGNQV